MEKTYEFAREHGYRMESVASFRHVFEGVTQAAESQGSGSGDRAQMVLLLEALIARMLEVLTGQSDTRILDLREVLGSGTAEGGRVADARLSPGMELDVTTRVTERIEERERSEFISTGKVRTIDGRVLDFTLNLSMCREYQCEREEARSEKIVLRDPLVINFDAASATLSGKRFDFDLEAIGTRVSVPALGAGSGYLVIDSNGDGLVNDGNELFGVRSGDGFADLALLDVDRNNWLDEADAAYDRVRIWQHGPDGQETLSALGERGVGAIFLGSVTTPFSLTDSENRVLAAIRASGIFLRENGSAGSVQQLDLVV